ncbi:hypothetical protein [Vibrio sp. D431a]|uniref:hypothetical protein n=1 Tax=Vibrio sp. D431a TaxID=2837388 RepID=UPI0025530648|nr:hypothetical protein [Vibrio sp. D431a]MDK9793695.1 hypothetical protein [Vibrio sp. D431a]
MKKDTTPCDNNPKLVIDMNRTNGLYFTEKNVEFTNKLLDSLYSNDWKGHVLSASAYESPTICLQKNNSTIFISSFCQFGKGDYFKNGSILINLELERLQTGFGCSLTISDNITAQVERISQKITDVINNPLSQPEFQGLGLYSKVHIGGEDLYVSTALFNDGQVLLSTPRDFNSFKIELDGAVCHGYKDGKHQYLGQDKLRIMSIKELEELTGRIWGKKSYTMKGAAIKSLQKYRRCVLVESCHKYFVTPASHIVSNNLNRNSIIAIGEDVPY